MEAVALVLLPIEIIYIIMKQRTWISHQARISIWHNVLHDICTNIELANGKYLGPVYYDRHDKTWHRHYFGDNICWKIRKDTFNGCRWSGEWISRKK